MKGRLGKTAAGISGTYEIVEPKIENMKKEQLCIEREERKPELYIVG